MVGSIYFGYDYIAQLGTLLFAFLFCYVCIYCWQRLAVPLIEKQGMIERVRFIVTEKELEKFCSEQKIPFSDVNVDRKSIYSTKNKLKARLRDIEELV